MQDELLSLFPDYLPLGLGVYDKDGFLKYANKVTLMMFGVTMKDIYNINIFDDPNITDQDKVKLRNGLDVSFETDYDFELSKSFYESQIKGVRKYFLTRVSIMRDVEGNRQGYLLSCEEVTDKKAREREILDGYRKIKAIQQELALALGAGKLVSWRYQIDEQAFYKFDDRIENLERETLETICGYIHPDERENFRMLLSNIADKQAPTTGNIVLQVREQGEEEYNRYYSFVYDARKNEAGYITAITFIQRDVTEDVKYQQNLISAKNKAEEADKLKSTFLANMSHEIRTPLNAIVGFSALLSDAEDTEEKSEYKQLIETNSEILLKLIGDILDLSKIEVGSLDINRQEMDLSHMCYELYRSFAQRIKNPDLTLKLVDPYARCIAKFDKHRFIQVFTNFVTNAIKYTPRGEIVMGYECAPGKVRIYVKDSGIGIPDEKKNRIFGRFEKLDNFAQGTGLGLSICKAIADATGGEVGFESKVGEGSEFWYIGYTEVEYEEKQSQTEVEVDHANERHEAMVASSSLKNLKILVAEDNDSNFLLMENILKENCLARAVTGVEVVEKAKSQAFDVVLMDLGMPVMDGLEATAQIREFNGEIPIIALTANAFDSDKDSAFTAGCNHFLAKPVKRNELLSLLSSFVDNK